MENAEIAERLDDLQHAAAALWVGLIGLQAICDEDACAGLADLSAQLAGDLRTLRTDIYPESQVTGDGLAAREACLPRQNSHNAARPRVTLATSK
jgi:hypothetical protein